MRWMAKRRMVKMIYCNKCEMKTQHIEFNNGQVQCQRCGKGSKKDGEK